MAAVGAGMHLQLGARNHSETISLTLRSVDNRKRVFYVFSMSFILCDANAVNERVWVRDNKNNSTEAISGMNGKRGKLK